MEQIKTVAEFMGHVYKFNKPYHHIQRMNEDGTPYDPPGTLMHSEWGMFNPHSDWNDLMTVLKKIEELPDKTISKYNAALRWNVVTCTYPDSLFFITVRRNITVNTNIDEMFVSAVEFIEWYNEQK